MWQVVAGKNPSRAWTKCRYRVVERSGKALRLGAGLSWHGWECHWSCSWRGFRILSARFPYVAQIQYLEKKGEVPDLGIKSINYIKIAFFLQISFPFTDIAWPKVGNICYLPFSSIKIVSLPSAVDSSVAHLPVSPHSTLSLRLWHFSPGYLSPLSSCPGPWSLANPRLLSAAPCGWNSCDTQFPVLIWDITVFSLSLCGGGCC